MIDIESIRSQVAEFQRRVRDGYSVLIAFDVRDPGLQHAAKKILCAGIRGKASRSQDLREARDALDRAIQEAERAEKGGA